MSKSMGIAPALGFKFVKDQTSVLHKPKVWYTYQQMEELFCFFGWWSQSCWFYSGCVSLWNLQGTLLLVRALPVVFVRVFVGVTLVVGLSKWGRCGLKILIVWQCLQSLIDGIYSGELVMTASGERLRLEIWRRTAVCFDCLTPWQAAWYLCRLVSVMMLRKVCALRGIVQ